ncbi:BON domain-containing protein [Dyella jejuensis]|uniref:BON domain-containing protein n=1 Tax=Dyella jejuensis TaxID=1432009 RepID=A0ABW8JI62_9GAMM
MTSKSSEAKTKAAAHDAEQGMTAQEQSTASTSALPSLHDPDDATVGFGPRSLDPDRRTERLSYRDPEEASQGPLRFDETNYSVERLTLPEGGFNEYADEYSDYRDQEGTPRQHYGPLREGQWESPQYADSTQNDLLAELSAEVSPIDEPDDPDLGFRLSAEDEDGQGADRLDLETSPDAYEVEKTPGFGHHAPRKPQPSDDRLREAVHAALDNGTDIDAPDISVHVKNGTVVIEGEVADAMLRHRVEQCVDSVEGVENIDNRLHLAASQPRRPWSDE